MRTVAALLVILGLTLAALPGLAAPQVEIIKVPFAEMTMNPNNLLSQQPFEREGGGYHYYQGTINPAPFGLTDALSATEPADILVFHLGAPRFDLGRPPRERELQKIVIWWTLAQAGRCALDVKFQVHDFTTGEWQDITDSIHHDFPPEAGMAGCLTLTFPPGEVKNFDSLRVIDNRILNKAAGTGWIEIEAYAWPHSR